MLEAVSTSRWWLAVAVVASACGAGATFQGEPPIEQAVPTASGPPPPLADDAHASVDQIYNDLVARQTALKLAKPPARDDDCQPVCKIDEPAGPPTKDAACTPAAGAACAATCTNADAACADAAKICAAAKQDASESALAGRCHEASETCTAAHAPCCACH
jgi:hypothetical protein